MSILTNLQAQDILCLSYIPYITINHVHLLKFTNMLISRFTMCLALKYIMEIKKVFKQINVFFQVLSNSVKLHPCSQQW